jgi:hypothetical protein
MRHTFSFLAPALALAAFAGCYTGSAVDTNRGPAPAADTNRTDPTVRDAGAARADAAAPALPRGIPCDVGAIVVNACGECHGAKPSGGASSRLVTYEDFKAISDDPSRSMAEMALARMKSSSRPMPPTARLNAASIAIFEKWVKAGLPRGSCGDTPDAGVTVDPPDAEPPPPEPTVCTSGVTAPPDLYGELMHPGQKCVSCHAENGATPFFAAGTVYPTRYEPDECHGAEGAKVLLIDAIGNVHSMATNGAGNFYLEATATPFPTPYRAIVVKGGDYRAMKTPQTNGDCNGCHTERGSGAPGRVMTP